jgi:hypothetical protein
MAIFTGSPIPTETTTLGPSQGLGKVVMQVDGPR